MINMLICCLVSSSICLCFYGLSRMDHPFEGATKFTSTVDLKVLLQRLEQKVKADKCLSASRRAGDVDVLAAPPRLHRSPQPLLLVRRELVEPQRTVALGNARTQWSLGPWVASGGRS